jgi:hypothetical protein
MIGMLSKLIHGTNRDPPTDFKVIILSLNGVISIFIGASLFFFGTTEVVNKYFFGFGPNEKLN